MKKRTSHLWLPAILTLVVAGSDLQSQTTFPDQRSFSPLVNRSVDLGDLSATARVLGDSEKCGPLNEKGVQHYHALLSAGAGHFYDDLLADLEEWQKSSYVRDVRSIGQSVQGREIWEMEITSPEPGVEGRHRVTIHARTHPHEIQSWWVVDNIIRYLLSDDPYAAHLRSKIRFHIYPMYNPDGVELRSTRYNANGVDLEREWDKEEPEPEAAALKARFGEFMNSSQPIRVALNLHSSSKPERYFWFHDASGTSPEFADIQRAYIGAVRSWFSMIQPWDYAVSWKNSAPTHFPESWFWYNYGTDVMALTYEDIFAHTLETPDAHFDSAGVALLAGVGDFLQIGKASVGNLTASGTGLLENARIDRDGIVRFELVKAGRYEVTLYDRVGRQIDNFDPAYLAAGLRSFAFDRNRATGLYYLCLRSGNSMQTVSLLHYRSR